MRISQLRLRLQNLGCKPCHEDRLLRGWSQVRSYDHKGSPAATFFPAALHDELPAIEAELNGLARLQSAHAASPTPAPTPEEAGKNNEVARLLVKLNDGQMVESVLLPRGGLCVSTQVGCAVGCTFCMSGRDGLQRQLGSAEILAQVVLARKRRAVSKVVFMGMGEPAHNLDNVLEAIDVLGTQGNIAHKNLVLSTVGDVRLFERLMERCTPHNPPSSCRESSTPATHVQEGVETLHNQSTATPIPTFPLLGGRQMKAHHPLGQNETVRPALALSLHTTDAALRAKLLPRAPQIPIEELVERAEAYARATHYPTQYQWTLLEGVNDSDAEIERIVQLLSGKYAIMNFIPFNNVDGLDFRRPSAERMAYIVGTLKQRGIMSYLRDSAGQEVEGACGQLRTRALRGA
jgi:23S rRNA (adenine2503-C2)-methyltransferase